MARAGRRRAARSALPSGQASSTSTISERAPQPAAVASMRRTSSGRAAAVRYMGTIQLSSGTADARGGSPQLTSPIPPAADSGSRHPIEPRPSTPPARPRTGCAASTRSAPRSAMSRRAPHRRTRRVQGGVAARPPSLQADDALDRLGVLAPGTQTAGTDVEDRRVRGLRRRPRPGRRPPRPRSAPSRDTVAPSRSQRASCSSAARMRRGRNRSRCSSGPYAVKTRTSTNGMQISSASCRASRPSAASSTCGPSADHSPCVGLRGAPPWP